jgi:hypothetical protein
MAIRCSIVGCEYDDTHIEREEERRGEEVILTVREFKECARCGNTELISENTGVTSVAQPESTEDGTTEGEEDPETEPPAEPTATEDPPIADPEGTAGGPDPDPEPAVTDDAVVLDDGPDPTDEPATADPAASGSGDPTDDPVGSEPWPGEASGPAGADAAAGGTADAPAGEPTDASATPDPSGGPGSDEAVTDDAVFIDGTGDRTGGLDEAAAMDDGPTITGSNDEEEYPEDDAVILDSSGSDDGGTGVGLGGDDWPEAGETTAGGWPEHDDHGGPGGRTEAGTAGWPDADAEDEGWDARTDDGDDADAEDVDFSGLTPTGSESAGAVTKNRPLSGESEAVEPDTEADAGGERAATGATTAAPETTGDASTRLVCSGCGHAVDRGSSPHRAGDICPDCSREYLAER